MEGKIEHVVLAYSGGLDTSVAIPWIREHYGARVTTLTVNVGQEGELGDALERARHNGAEEALFVDAREALAEEFIFPALQANCLYQGVYPLSTALARPLIARHLVRAALSTKAEAVAHGCTGKGNDQVRFDVAVQTLAPHLRVIAPVREWNMNRSDEMLYAREHGLRIHVKPESPYSVDENLWGRSVEGGVLEDPAASPPEEVFQWTGHPADWPSEPEELTVSFYEGTPQAINGRALPPVALISEMNARAGKHGVGRIDHVEDRVVGIKSRETYECPAAVALITAHQALESLVLPRDLLSFKSLVDRRFADAVYEGLWYTPLREALSAFTASTQTTVTGEVRLRFYQGSVRVTGRSSPYSLLSHELSTYGRGSTFRQDAAEGFIHLFGLAPRLAYEKRRVARSPENRAEETPAPGAVSPATPP
jgi:argininosuccinate synthase